MTLPIQRTTLNDSKEAENRICDSVQCTKGYRRNAACSYMIVIFQSAFVDCSLKLISLDRKYVKITFVSDFQLNNPNEIFLIAFILLNSVLFMGRQ